MKKQEFIDQWKHQLAGIVLDAATAGRTGADLAFWLRNIMKQIDVKLAVMYDQLKPPEPLPINGAQQKGKVTT